MFKKIAVIEYEGIIALDLKTVLENNGAEEVWTYNNISSFITSLNDKKPDLIIIDSQESITQEKVKLFTESYGIPVIYLSDYPNEADLYKQIHNCFYMRKPFEKKELIRILDKTG